MKFAICNETFLDWPFPKACEFAAECGYTGLEIAPFTLDTDVRRITPAQIRDTKAAASAAGLEILGLHWLLAKTEGFYLTSPDAAVRRRTVEYLIDLIRCGHALGGNILVFGSPGQRNVLPGVTHAEATAWAIEAFREVVPVLAECGATLALEPLGPSEGNFLTTAREAADMIAAIDSPQVRLHLDCKAMSSESRPIPEIIREFAPLTAHFHVNDPNRQGPGFGELQFEPILAALLETGYSGWVSVEVFDYSPGIERLARQSIDYLRDCLKRLGAEG